MQALAKPQPTRGATTVPLKTWCELSPERRAKCPEEAWHDETGYFVYADNVRNLNEFSRADAVAGWDGCAPDGVLIRMLDCGTRLRVTNY